jgi:hypothetical protein
VKIDLTGSDTPAATEPPRHTCTDEANGGGDGECLACGARDCPSGEPWHYHHDGCPACDYTPSPAAPTEAAADAQARKDGWTLVDESDVTAWLAGPSPAPATPGKPEDAPTLAFWPDPAFALHPSCTAECAMFGPAQPEGPGSCRESCRLLRGEPKMPTEPPPAEVFQAAAFVVVALDDDEGLVLLRAAQAAKHPSIRATFQHALVAHVHARVARLA